MTLPDPDPILRDFGVESVWLYENQRTEPGPEIRLLIAILDDAITIACSSNEECEEARHWIVDNDETWVFSFINICDALGMDVGQWRRRIMGHQGWQLAPIPSPRYHYKRRARAKKNAQAA